MCAYPAIYFVQNENNLVVPAVKRKYRPGERGAGGVKTRPASAVVERCSPETVRRVLQKPS
jgi:hypothetical protein